MRLERIWEVYEKEGVAGVLRRARAKLSAAEPQRLFPAGAPTEASAPPGKHEKLRRIAPHLRCPECSHRLDLDRMRCSTCGAAYRKSPCAFDFLSEQLRNEFSIVDTENVSANEYDPIALDLISTSRDGLVLDCGAGRRSIDHPNVVNFEIVAYPSTDVLGVGEKLPFADGTFDGALSLAVLEHVKDPFRCARELARVVRKGGRLYCAVPFLQPVHAYPNHFYNMTAQGLRSLFEDSFHITAQDVPLSGVPIWTLASMLRSWSQGLPESARAEFLALRVDDLVGDPTTYLERSFVRDLPPEKNFELASVTTIVATRR